MPRVSTKSRSGKGYVKKVLDGKKSKAHTPISKNIRTPSLAKRRKKGNSRLN